MRRRIAALALLAVLLALSGCRKAADPVPGLAEPVGVQSDTAVAVVRDICRLQLYDAAVSPHVETLSLDTDGRVLNVPIYPGMMVEAGDVLVELDLREAAGEVEALERELEYLERDYAYEDELGEIDLGILSLALRALEAEGADETRLAEARLDIEEKEAQLRQAKALREPELAARRQRLDALRRALEKGVLRAPYSGRVVACDGSLKAGASVRAGAPLVYLADDTRLSLQCAYIPEVTLNAASRIYARVGATDLEVSPNQISHEAYVAATLAGNTPSTVFTVTGPEEALAGLEAGQYAAVFLVLGYVRDALTVPSGAVLHESGGRYVYVDRDGERERRNARVGATMEGLTQIVEGLQEGEVVYVKD